MGIDHGGAHILMAKQFLDLPDVIAVVQRVGGERMPQRVATGWLNNRREEGSFLA